MSIFGGVLVFVKSAVGPVGTAIAGTRGAVASGAAERGILGAVRRTMSLEVTLTVVGAFKRKAALMRKFPVSLDFLANGGLVLANGESDSSFSRAIGDTGKDDASFL